MEVELEKDQEIPLVTTLDGEWSGGACRPDRWDFLRFIESYEDMMGIINDHKGNGYEWYRDMGTITSYWGNNKER